MMTAAALKALIYPALALTSVTPVVLIYLVIKDVRSGKLW